MSSIMLIASDNPLQEVSYPPDFAINLDIDHGMVDDGGMDDGFAIFSTGRVPEIPSGKAYFAILEWQYTPGRAKRVIEYLEKCLQTAGEIEVWHVWQDMDFDHKVRKIEIPIHTLTADDIRELDQLEVWKEPVTDYCYMIT